MEAVLTSVRRSLAVVLISISLIVSFPGGAVARNASANADTMSNPWVGMISWNSKRQPSPVSLLEKLNGQRILQPTAHGVTKSRTQLSTRAGMSGAKHLLMCFLAISDMFSLEKCLFRPGLFASVILSCMNCLCTLEVNPLTVTSFANIFSHSVGCLFVLFMVSFTVRSW